MNKPSPTASGTWLESALKTARAFDRQRLVVFYARAALGAAFLSGIASRFGLYGSNVGYGNFANFVKYTGEVNAFMPAPVIPFLAWAATAAELALGIALILERGRAGRFSRARRCWPFSASVWPSLSASSPHSTTRCFPPRSQPRSFFWMRGATMRRSGEFRHPKSCLDQ